MCGLNFISWAISLALESLKTERPHGRHVTTVIFQGPQRARSGQVAGRKKLIAQGLTEQTLWVSLNLDDVKGRLRIGGCCLVTLQVGEP